MYDSSDDTVERSDYSVQAIAGAVVFLAGAVLFAAAGVGSTIFYRRDVDPWLILLSFVVLIIGFIWLIIGWRSAPLQSGGAMKAIAAAVVFLAGVVLFASGTVTTAIRDAAALDAARRTDSVTAEALKRSSTGEFLMGAGVIVIVGFFGFILINIGWRSAFFEQTGRKAE
jgi:hypothetical protein